MGFGNVHINFETPAGYLLGFRDYLNFLAGAAIGTQVGPVAYVGNYGGVREPDVDDDGHDSLSSGSQMTSTKMAFLASIVIIVGPDGES